DGISTTPVPFAGILIMLSICPEARRSLSIFTEYFVSLNLIGKAFPFSTDRVITNLECFHLNLSRLIFSTAGLGIIKRGRIFEKLNCQEFFLMPSTEIFVVPST